MNKAKLLQLFVWILTAAVVTISLYVWWPATEDLTGYSLFPVFGLLAFGLMWTHYIAGALRRYLDVPVTTLKRHFQITSYIVLLLILAHPFLLEFQLYLDGFGLPPASLLATYPALLHQIAILGGVTALTCFLLFELHRFYKNKTWWKYIEWANIAAMVIILLHGFTLGGELRQPWFQVVWVFYAITFIGAVAYTGYHKRRKEHGRNQVI